MSPDLQPLLLDPFPELFVHLFLGYNVAPRLVLIKRFRSGLGLLSYKSVKAYLLRRGHLLLELLESGVSTSNVLQAL